MAGQWQFDGRWQSGVAPDRVVWLSQVTHEAH